jgi:hypothetical protein
VKTSGLGVHACSTCHHFSCICQIQKEHVEECLFRKAATCTIPIACEQHNRDTCPICDPCTCPE